MATISGFTEVAAYLKKREDQAPVTCSVITGYTANYALFVHENIEMKLAGQPRPKNRGLYWDPQGRGQAKFLEQPARQLAPTLGKVVSDVVRNGGTLLQGLYVAALMIQRASMLLCPVDFSNLKSSAFTRKELCTRCGSYSAALLLVPCSAATSLIELRLS